MFLCNKRRLTDFRFTEIETYLKKPAPNPASKKWSDDFQKIYKDFKDELEESAGSNLLVSDVRTTYSNAQQTCRQMGMNLGEGY